MSALAKVLLAPIALTIAVVVMMITANISSAVTPEPPAPTHNTSRVAVEDAVQLAINAATAKR